MILNEFIDILVEYRNKEPLLGDASIYRLVNPGMGYMDSAEELPSIFYHLKEDILAASVESVDSYGYAGFDDFYEENETEYASMEEALTAFNNLYSPIVVI